MIEYQEKQKPAGGWRFWLIWVKLKGPIVWVGSCQVFLWGRSYRSHRCRPWSLKKAALFYKRLISSFIVQLRKKQCPVFSPVFVFFVVVGFFCIFRKFSASTGREQLQTQVFILSFIIALSSLNLLSITLDDNHDFLLLFLFEGNLSLWQVKNRSLFI